MSELLLTRQSEDDEGSKHVWVLCQHARGFHGHVFPAEILNVLSDQLIKGCTPSSGHTRSSCAQENIHVN